MNPKTPVITQLDMSLSDKCNLNCSFCYTHGGFGKPFNQELVDKTFNWFFKQFEDSHPTPDACKKGLSVTIYGGEPTVEWTHLKEVVLAKKALATEKGFALKFGIVTNMTLLTEDKLDWLIANKVSISCSIDGCPAAQDMERKYHDGTGSSAVVYENAKRLLSKIGGGCRMTIAPATVQYTFESVVFLAKEVGFNNISPVMAGGVVWTAEKLAIHIEQMEKVTDWWIDEMRKGNFYDLYYFRHIFQGLWSGKRKRVLCAAAKGYVGVDTNGDIYPCHLFCNLDTTPEYLLGNLDTGYTNLALRETLMNFDIAEVHKEKCKNCPAVLGCHCFCLHEIMMERKGMFDPPAHSCVIWPAYWRMGMRAHSILTAENNQLYLSKYDPNYKKPAVKAQTPAQKKALEPKKSPYVKDKVYIKEVRVSNMSENRLFVVSYQCLGDDGKTVLSNKKTFTMEEFGSIIPVDVPDVKGLLGTIDVLLPKDGKRNLFINLAGESITFRSMALSVEDGKNKWNAVVFTNKEVEQAGLNMSVLRSVVALLEKSLIRSR